MPWFSSGVSGMKLAFWLDCLGMNGWLSVVKLGVLDGYLVDWFGLYELV
jgi:hypothetical protein